MKRVISLFLILCLCTGLILPAAAADAADATVPTDYWTDSGNYTEPTIDPATKTVTPVTAENGYRFLADQEGLVENQKVANPLPEETQKELNRILEDETADYAERRKAEK